MTTTSFLLSSAGQRVLVESAVPRLATRLAAASGHAGRSDHRDGPCDVHLRIEADHRPFSKDGMLPVTRGAWTDGAGNVLFASTGGSGHSQLWSTAPASPLTVRSRWLPSAAQAVAAGVLRSRQRALEAEVLLHYPTLWSASRQGLAPLHVSALRVEDVVVVLAGPGGLGKSTMVSVELTRGAVALCDNIAVSDGVALYGLAEALRVERGTPVPHSRRPRRALNGRREYDWGPRPAAMVPDLLVVVRRGNGESPTLRETTREAAARTLAAGTFAAGELSRFWPLSATLALATSGPAVLPAVDEVATRLTGRVPCFELELGRPGVPLRTVLSGLLADLHGTRSVR